MAGTTNAPYGLRPFKHLMGTPWNGQTYRAFVEDSYGTALYPGDPIKKTGAVGSDMTHGRHGPSIEIASTGDANKLFGVIVSVEKVTPTGNLLDTAYIPASTGGYVNIVIDPFVIFMIQGDGTATTSDSCGLNCNLESGTGSTYTSMSAYVADISGTPAANASNQLYILQAVDMEGNDITDSYADFEVLINAHELNSSVDNAAAVCGNMLGI